MDIDWRFTRRWCCFWPVGAESGFWRSLLIGCMVNFLLSYIVCLVWVVDYDMEHFSRICVVSLNFSSFPVNMAVVIVFSGHLLLR
jgi:hypothetical protein